MGFLSDFKAPPAQNRARPFWFWNGDMQDEIIKEQIAEMAQKGLGGFFICARQGLKIPYLSQEWFRKVSLACQCAQEHGLECWLYDEYPYPSGMAGGEVLVRHPEAAHRILTFHSFAQAGETLFQHDLGQGGVLCVKGVPLDGTGEPVWSGAVDLSAHVGILQPQEICQPQNGAYIHLRYFTYGVRHVLHAQLPPGQWRIFAATEEPLPDYKYYGNFFDPCCKEAVRTFLELTHEQYRAHLGGEFGKGLRGIFSDETGLLGETPWSHQMLTEFPRRKGYALQEHLLALAHASYPGAASIRRDYIEVLNAVFVESYHKQIADWCRKHHLLYASEVPSLRMSTQKYSSVVGGDTGHEKAGKPLSEIYDTYLCGYRYNAKHVASLACQLNRRYAMIESYHSVGWTMTLQDAKWMLDRIGSEGINLFNFHAFCYTIDTLAKFDAPPSQFVQNPYWKHYKLFADYAGRMSVFNTSTVPAEGIAVLDPAASLWSLSANPLHGFAYGGQDEAEKARLNAQVADWKWVSTTLLQNQYNYQTLDAELLCGASLQDGALHLGRAAYRVVVIPPLDFLEEEALAALRRFAACGGTVLSFGSACLQVPCKILQIGQTAALLAAVRAAVTLPAQVRVARPEKDSVIVSQRRARGGAQFVFVANQGKAPAHITVCPRDEAVCTVRRWCLETGRRQTLALQGRQLPLVLAPFESCLLELSREKPLANSAPQLVQSLVLDTARSMKLTAERPNIFRLDEFMLSLDAKHWRKAKTPTAIEQLSETGLLDARHLRWHGKFGTPKKIAVQYPLTLFYKKYFYIEKIPNAVALMLDAGCIGGAYRLCINGRELSQAAFQPCFYYDSTNRSQPVTQYLVKGENSITLEVTARQDADGLRNPLYLCGDFGVYFSERHAYLSGAPREGAFAWPHVHGYPFYSGTLCFETQAALPKQADTVVTCGFADSRQDCMELLVNGRSAGVRAFTPYRWSVPKALVSQGENKWELRVTNTLSNCMEGTVFDSARHKVVGVQEAARAQEKRARRKAAGGKRGQNEA